MGTLVLLIRNAFAAVRLTGRLKMIHLPASSGQLCVQRGTTWGRLSWDPAVSDQRPTATRQWLTRNALEHAAGWRAPHEGLNQLFTTRSFSPLIKRAHREMDGRGQRRIDKRTLLSVRGDVNTQCQFALSSHSEPPAAGLFSAHNCVQMMLLI